MLHKLLSMRTQWNRPFASEGRLLCFFILNGFHVDASVFYDFLFWSVIELLAEIEEALTI
jgi:hypothetical protein